jgi:hypothetical protein
MAQNRPQVRVEVVEGDVREFLVDVLALKFAQNLYGADLAVYQELSARMHMPELPGASKFTLINSLGCIAAKRVLFVGVPALREFGYEQIREFSKKALISLNFAAPDTQHLGLTIHGPGYGLDESEAFEAEIAGLVDAFTSGDLPEGLGRISIVERSPARVERLKERLFRLLPAGKMALDERGRLYSLGDAPAEQLRAAGHNSGGKPHIFVAMPFDESMDDIFHYGIQGAVNAAGFLCERADLSTFTGDVMDWVKKRIITAALVIADLSTANPNVYLEVGYAWGCSKPTVLLVRDATQLKFDVKGQRCLVYKTIKSLEEALRNELQGLEKAVQRA